MVLIVATSRLLRSLMYDPHLTDPVIILARLLLLGVSARSAEG